MSREQDAATLIEFNVNGACLGTSNNNINNHTRRPKVNSCCRGVTSRTTQLVHNSQYLYATMEPDRTG